MKDSLLLKCVELERVLECIKMTRSVSIALAAHFASHLWDKFMEVLQGLVDIDDMCPILLLHQRAARFSACRFDWL